MDEAEEPTTPGMEDEADDMAEEDDCEDEVIEEMEVGERESAADGEENMRDSCKA